MKSAGCSVSVARSFLSAFVVSGAALCLPLSSGKAQTVGAGGSLDSPGGKGPDIHELYKNSSVAKRHKDISMFHHIPKGDRIVYQLDHGRLLFQNRAGQPDGYAQRRGRAILYYDAAGKASRIQYMTEDEIARLDGPAGY